MKRFIHSYLICLLILGCNPKKPDFSNWLTKQVVSSEQQNIIATYSSSPLKIDTIYRSMQGPYEVKNISIPTDDDFVWLSGYRSQLVDVNSQEEVSSRYMCHNNLNYANTASIPWERKTSAKNSRLFTLSEGQTSLIFPKGYGIPILRDQELQMVSQVLNHHESFIDKEIQHQVEILYSTGNHPEMKALYQQPIFITKQLSGPDGAYGLPNLCTNHHLESAELRMSATDSIHRCDVAIDTEDYNPYEDGYGRTFTGHWVIPYGREVLTTNVTPMLNLKENNRIHLISVHLHPYAESFRFIDRSNDEVLYEAEIVKDSLAFGFESIGYYSSDEGIKLFADRQYDLECTYHCTDSLNTYTAMAVMYLFLEE